MRRDSTSAAGSNDITSSRAPRPTSFDALEERVFTQGQNVRELQQDIAALDTKFTAGMNNLSRNFDEKLNLIASKLDDHGKFPWGAIGVIVPPTIILATALFLPLRETDSLNREAIKETQALLTKAVQDITYTVSANTKDAASTYVRKDDQEARRQQTNERLTRIEMDVRDARESIVPRAEHAEKWSSFNTQLANIQRQVDETKQSLYVIYTPTKAIDRLFARVDELEAELRRVMLQSRATQGQ